MKEGSASGNALEATPNPLSLIHTPLIGTAGGSNVKVQPTFNELWGEIPDLRVLILGPKF
jgi:hypothetical protein